MQFSNRISDTGESRTARFIPLVNRMKQEGRQVINLAIGEPEYDIPEPVADAVKQALEKEQIRYGPVSGMDRLKNELAKQFKGYTADNIIVSNGSKQILYSLFQVILNPGDEVIIPRPCWVSFPEQVKLAGGVPVLVDTRQHQLDLDKIEKALSKKTKAILINSPNNPTGAMYPARDLAEIAKIARAADLWLVSDEAYDFFVYDDRPIAGLFSCEEIRDRLVVTRSFSKHFSMTGFRVGYGAGPDSLVRAMTTLQSHLSGNVCTLAQFGALAALKMDPAIADEWWTDLKKKRDMAFDRLSPLFDCIKPKGAFYLFPDIRHHLKNRETDADFAHRLLLNAGVAVVPGIDFEGPGHVRISFAIPFDNLVLAIDKIKNELM